jgi:hypothetical protein
VLNWPDSLFVSLFCACGENTRQVWWSLFEERCFFFFFFLVFSLICTICLSTHAYYLRDF